MEVEVYDDITRNSAGTDIWRHIEKTSEDFNPFQRLAWARSWLSCYNNILDTIILVAREGSDAMVLPLMVHEGVLRTLCYNAADVTGSIFTGNPSLPSARIADYLTSGTKYNEKLLWNILPDDPLVKTLKIRNNLELVECVPAHSLNIANIRTNPNHWLNSSATRKQANRDLRRLIRKGATLRHRVSPKEVELDALMDIHDRVWRAKGSSGKFEDQRRRRFVQLLANDGFPVCFSTLSLGKLILAYNMLFSSNKSVRLWNSGYNIDFSRLGPGSALLVADILDIAHTTNYLSYDFLRGDEKYKLSYTNSKYEIHTYKIK